MDDKNLHTVQIDGQKRIYVTAVREVESVTDEKISLLLFNDKKLTVIGQSLKMGGFSKQNATFVAEGVVLEVKYGYKKGSLIKKLLKWFLQYKLSL